MGIAIAVEYILGLLDLRAGADSSNPGYSITAGFGVNCQKQSIDYAFNPHIDIGDSHKVSMKASYRR